MLDPGSRIVKVACPPDCGCDGKYIPPGTVGKIHESKDYVQRRLTPNGKRENCYLCSWECKKSMWWTYEHGIELEGSAFPDLLYLEGVE